MPAIESQVPVNWELGQFCPERELFNSVANVPWRAFRTVKDSRMTEINVYWFYWLSMTLFPLNLIKEGTHLSFAAEHLGIARGALESMQGKHVFPKTSERMRELVEIINNMIPPDPSLWRDRLVTLIEATQLKSAFTALALTLEQESRHSYVLCVEDQRCFSAYTLVERIDNCFAQESWDAIEKEAKREFEESGKCLAVERYTGAGFHALRGVECVIRQYIVELTGALPKKRDWGHYIEVLKQNGADASLIAVLDNIRTLDRNPLIHAEHWLNIDDGIGIFTISQTAIVRLVEGIKKVRASRASL